MFDSLKGRRKQERLNLSELAYEKIRDAIIFDKFKPEDILSESALADSLNMSRTPIREAFKKLASEGLIEILPGRGAYVKQVTLKDLNEIYELRLLFEKIAIKTAIRNISEAEIIKMEETWRTLLNRVVNGEDVDWVDIIYQDDKLHSFLVAKCENSRLIKFMEMLSQQNLRLKLLSAKALSNQEDTINQHLEIINLIKEKDIEKLEKVLDRHIVMSKKNIINMLQKGNSASKYS